MTYANAYGTLTILIVGYCVNCVYDSIEVSTLDKYEYKIRSEEIKALIGRKKYTEAMEIADMIDWRRVKNVNMLCTVSDLYKLNRRYEESREILLLAYERHPGGRMIIYSLCELSIKLDDVVRAVEYYKEFVQTAPRDNGRYVLQYKLYEAQEVTLEERIAVLEELKRREYREKWAYELAYLYHRIGLSTKCVEECDELILWFGEGKYVIKAMELKMLHTPLSPEQLKKYKKSKGNTVPVVQVPEKEDDELDIQVQPVNVGEYATINLQKELAESMKEVLAQETTPIEAQPTIEYSALGTGYQTDEFRNYETDTGEFQNYAAGSDTDEFAVYGVESQTDEFTSYGVGSETEEFQKYEEETGTDEYEEYITEPQTEEKDNDISTFQKERQQEFQELELDGPGDFTREILSNLLQGTEEADTVPAEEIEDVKLDIGNVEEVPDAEEIFFEDTDTIEIPQTVYGNKTVVEKVKNVSGDISGNMTMPSAETMSREKNENFDSLLSQEYDGQISLALSAGDTVEKQITGQMSIEDILLEWERMKKENEEKRAEAVRQRVKEQTGEIFAQFDESTKQGILAELDAIAEDSIEKEKKGFTKEEEKKLEKVVDMEEDLPEVEELEEIEETTPTESFSEETRKAVNKAAERMEKEPDNRENVMETEEEMQSVPVRSEEKLEKETEQETKPSDNHESLEAETVSERKKPEPLRETEKNIKNEPEKKTEKSYRPMTAEEKKLFGPFIQTKTTKNQILDTLDNISLASCTGNVILTGEPGMGSIKLAKNIIREIQMTDSNFSGKMAKITGQALNRKDLQKTFEKLSNGALIVEGAANLKESVIQSMTKLLEQDKQGIIVILEDTKINMNKMLDNYKLLERNFNLRIDVEALDNDSLVLFAKKYAYEKEYTIDELGVLALYTRIAELQTSEHSVTTKEVKEIVDEAIYHADKKNMGHFMDVLFGKRYDDDDMIVLREKDFV